MLTRCAEAVAAVGGAPTLTCVPMHALDLSRRDRTVFVCGGLGLGSTREQDQEGLRRLHDHLEPGGRLVLDNEVPWSSATQWARWPAGGAQDLQEPEGPDGERRPGP